MGVQLPVATDNAVIRILGRILGWDGFETRPLLHAFEDEVDTVPVLAFHAFQVRPYVFLLAYPFLGLFRSEEHTSELQSLTNLVCRLLLEKKKKNNKNSHLWS